MSTFKQTNSLSCTSKAVYIVLEILAKLPLEFGQINFKNKYLQQQNQSSFQIFVSPFELLFLLWWLVLCHTFTWFEWISGIHLILHLEASGIENNIFQPTQLIGKRKLIKNLSYCLLPWRKKTTYCWLWN